jgi:hypothetical protein
MTDRITQACLSTGAYTISVGTMNPTVVLARMLDALSVLDPRVHRELTAPGADYAAVPADSLRDGSSGWWESEAADRLIQGLLNAINAAAPKGFCCVYSEGDRLELFYCGPSPGRREGAPPPSVRRRFSAIRPRVRATEPC